jgi:hypothetical protein
MLGIFLATTLFEKKARYIALKDHRVSTLFFYPIGRIGSSFFLMKKEVVALCLARYFFPCS